MAKSVSRLLAEAVALFDEAASELDAAAAGIDEAASEMSEAAALIDVAAMNAALWMANLSTAGRLAVDVPAPAPSVKVVISEYWDGRQWLTRRCVWNGEKYAEVAPC